MVLLENQMLKSAVKIEKIKQKMSELGEIKISTAELKKLQETLEDTKKEYDKLYNDLSNFGLKEIEDMRKADPVFDNVARRVEELESEIEILNQTGKAFTLGSDTDEYSNLSAQLQEEQARLNDLTEQYQSLSASVGSSEAWQGLANKFTQIRSAASKAFSSIASGAKKAVSVLNTVAKGAKKVVSGFVSLTKQGTKLLGFFGKLSITGPLALTKLGKSSNSAGGVVERFGKRVWGLAKRVFVFSLITKGFRAMLSGLQDGFTTYLGYDKTLNSFINNLKASLSTLKASLGSAFAPIVSAVVPYLQTMINWLITAVNAVGAFIAALTGQSTYKKASAGISSIGDAASGAADSVKELKKELAGYDELNVISQDSGSGGSGGGGGGTSSGGDITYTDTEIGESISNFAERLKEAWAQADFTEIGGIVGQKIEDALNTIDWDGIQTISAKVGKSVATFVNGAVETSGLADTLGMTVGELLNTGISGADAFLDNLHFDSLGEFVADAVNSSVATIHWDEAGEVIRTGLNGIFQAAATWANKFNFEQLGSAVKTTIVNSINGLNWDNAFTFAKKTGEGIAKAFNKILTTDTLGSIGTTFGSAVETIVEGAYSFVENADWKQWGTSLGTGLNNFFKKLDWKKAGLTFSDAVKGICNTLSSAISTTDWTTVGEDIATALKNVDWKGILKSAADLIASTFSGLLDLGSVISTRLFGNEWDNYILDTKEETRALKSVNDEIQNYIDNADDWKKAAENEYGYAEDLAKQYFDLAEKESLTNEEKEQMKSLASELVDTVPELKTYYNSETKLLDTTRSSVDSLISSLKKKAETEAAQEELVELYKQQYAAVKNINDAEQQYQELYQNKKDIVKTYKALVEAEEELKKQYESGQISYEKYAEKHSEIETALGDEDDKLKKLNKSLDDNRSVVDEAKNEYDAAGAKIDEITNYMASATEGTSKWSKALSDLPKEIQTIITVKGLDATLDEEVKVVAEVTGLDTTKMTDKEIEDCYAEIVKGYQADNYETPNVEATAELTTTKDSVPAGQKKMDLIAEFKEKTDSLSADQKKIDTTANYTNTENSVPEGQRKMDLIAEFKEKKDSLTAEQKQIDTTSNYKSSKNGLTNDQRTIATWANYKSTKNSLTDTKRTINVWANYKSSKNNLTEKQRTIASWANYTKSQDSLSAAQKTLSVTGNAKTVNQGYKDVNAPTVSVKANIVGQVGTPTVKANLQASKAGIKWVANGGVFSGGIWRNISQFATGGILEAGKQIARFATGGLPNYGTAFIAGEAGPEVVGHIGGRTEVLNQSQLASVMYSAIVAGMSATMASYIQSSNETQITCANAIAGILSGVMEKVQEINERTYKLDFNAPSLGQYEPTTDVNRINAIRDGVNASGAISSNNTAWMDALVDKISNASGGNYTFVAQLNGREIFRETVTQNQMYKNQTGHSAF